MFISHSSDLSHRYVYILHYRLFSSEFLIRFFFPPQNKKIKKDSECELGDLNSEKSDIWDKILPQLIIAVRCHYMFFISFLFVVETRFYTYHLVFMSCVQICHPILLMSGLMSSFSCLPDNDVEVVWCCRLLAFFDLHDILLKDLQHFYTLIFMWIKTPSWVSSLRKAGDCFQSESYKLLCLWTNRY